MTVALYGFGYVPAIERSSCKENDHYIYIDSGINRNIKLEDYIRTTERAAYRMCWTPFESVFGRLDKLTLNAVLPYSNPDLIVSISEKIKSLGCMQVPKVDELFYMSQRTHLCSLKPTEALYLFSQCYRFFIAYLKHACVKAIVSSEIPHHVIDYILCISAKSLNVPFICQILQGPTHSALYLNMSSGNYIPNKRCFGHNHIYFNDIDSFLNRFLPNQHQIKSSYLPTYSDESLILAEISRKRIFSFLNSGSSHSTRVINLLYESVRAYNQLILRKPLPDFCEGIIHYFFAHLQPEATTSPMCGIMADHRNCLNEIATSMNSDDILVYKEHPAQFKFLPLMYGSTQHINSLYSTKSPEYYQSVVSINNCFLAPRSLTSAKILSQNNIKIWSPNGTVMLEAFLAEKSVGFFDTLTPWNDLITSYSNKSSSGNQRLASARLYLNSLSWPIICSDIYLTNEVAYSQSYIKDDRCLDTFLKYLVQTAVHADE